MMTGVMRTLNDGGQLLVEAGTGTGKSVAYLLPAILHAVERGEPVIISTNTIALQDQLFRKDLPDLRRTLQSMAQEHPELAPAADFQASLLKGRANYLCLRRWFMAQREPAVQPEEASLHAKVLTWIQQTETGDRAELHLAPDEQIHWNRLAEEEGACVPGRCVFHRRNQCFLFRARHKAESAHVVVVNHALLLSDMLASNTVLPPYRHLIIDEAHNLEEEATSQLGFTLTRGRVVDFLDRCLTVEGSDGLGGVIGNLWRSLNTSKSEPSRDLAARMQPRLDQIREAVGQAGAHTERCFQQLGDFVDRYREDRSDYDRRLRLTDAVRHDAGWGEVEAVWEEAARRIRQIIQELTWLVQAVDPLTDEDVAEVEDVKTELDLLIRSGRDLLDRTVAAISEPDVNGIYWLSQHAMSGEVSIHGAPRHVGAALQEHLFDRCRSVILTSATMTTEKGFDYIRDRLGLQDAEEMKVSSPFDYESSALIYLTNDIPEPGQAGYQRYLQETLVELCRATRGRAMILFTSHSALQATYRAIKRPLEAEGILVLGQRLDGSPRQLVERLRNHPESVLLGTNSFWEGVDIVGDSLSLLVISKLPFSVPSDPIFAVRSEDFDDPFLEYAIPQAVLRFKQGFGRLIRSATDRGVCAILDRRVVSRRYGNSFVRALPKCTVVTGSGVDLPSQAEEWLHRPVYDTDAFTGVHRRG